MPIVSVKPLRGPDAKAIVRKLAAQSRGVTDGTLNEIGQGMLADLQGVTSDWHHQPAFTQVRTLNTVKVVTDDRIFKFINAGTRPHIIAAKPGKVLVFRSGYAPRTRVNNTRFHGAGKASGPQVFARVVHHPGSQARHFTRIILNRWQTEGLRIVKRRTKETVSQRNP